VTRPLGKGKSVIIRFRAPEEWLPALQRGKGLSANVRAAVMAWMRTSGSKK
jgi:hypothetical protein